MVINYEKGVNMSKVFGTKKRIVALLNKRPMNITEISEALSLSKPTISQHISELEDMGLINRVDNSHYKRVQYFVAADAKKEVQRSEVGSYKIILPIVAAVLLAAIIIYSTFNANNNAVNKALLNKSAIVSNNTTINSNTTNTSTHIRTIGASACPMMPEISKLNYTSGMSILKEVASGSPCALTYVNTSAHTVAGANYTSSNGTISIPSAGIKYSINSSIETSLRNDVNNGNCYDNESLALFGINYTIPKSVTCKSEIFN